MGITELHTKVQAVKTFLNQEIIRHRLQDTTNLSLQEIQTRLDMIHEVERVGIRNLDERGERKLVRMITDIESVRSISLN